MIKEYKFIRNQSLDHILVHFLVIFLYYRFDGPGIWLKIESFVISFTFFLLVLTIFLFPIIYKFI